MNPKNQNINVNAAKTVTAHLKSIVAAAVIATQNNETGHAPFSYVRNKIKYTTQVIVIDKKF